MEKRLEALLEAVRAVQPALTNFCNGLSDEQKARIQYARLNPIGGVGFG